MAGSRGDRSRPVSDAPKDEDDAPATGAPARRGQQPSLAHLYGRLALIEARVRGAVERRRATDPDPNDRFRGLYLSDAQVDQLLTGQVRIDDGPIPELDQALARLEARADLAEVDGADLRLRRLALSFGLDQLDVEILLIALAPDLDPRFERLYAYLHDDVSRRRASAGLALELSAAGGPDADASTVERTRLGTTARLVRAGLVLVEEPERPFLTRSLRVPDRVTGHLLGDDTPEPALADLLIDSEPVGDGERLAGALLAGQRLIHLREARPGVGASLAAAANPTARRPVHPV